MSFRWGIVGFGWVARDHMASAISAAGQQLAIVADPSPKARAKAQAIGIEAVATTTELLERRPDAIYIATPNHLHRPPIVEAAKAGIPILCEKPMAATLADAEAIARVAEGVLYGTAFDQRHHPAHRVIAAEIARGSVGQVTAVRVNYACWVDPQWRSPGAESDDFNWRADPAVAGGGAVMDLGLHGLDLAQMLLGEPLERLHIELQRRVHAYAVDDGGILSGRFASGALFQAHVAYNCPEPLPRRRLEIIGDAGAIVATDTMGQSAGGSVVLTCGRLGTELPIAFDRHRSPFEAQASAFAAAVKGERHDFSLSRDIALMRLFAGAHDKALLCL